MLKGIGSSWESVGWAHRPQIEEAFQVFRKFLSLRSRRIRGGVGEEEETQLNFADKPIVNAWDRLCVGNKFSHKPQLCPRPCRRPCPSRSTTLQAEPFLAVHMRVIKDKPKKRWEALLAGCLHFKRARNSFCDHTLNVLSLPNVKSCAVIRLSGTASISTDEKEWMNRRTNEQTNEWLKILLHCNVSIAEKKTSRQLVRTLKWDHTNNKEIETYTLNDNVSSRNLYFY